MQALNQYLLFLNKCLEMHPNRSNVIKLSLRIGILLSTFYIPFQKCSGLRRGRTTHIWKLSLGLVQWVAKRETASRCGAGLRFCTPRAGGLLVTRSLVGACCRCLLGAEIRQAFAQAVPPAWDIFSRHYSFVKIKVKCHPLCGTILKQNLVLSPLGSCSVPCKYALFSITPS